MNSRHNKTDHIVTVCELHVCAVHDVDLHVPKLLSCVEMTLEAISMLVNKDLVMIDAPRLLLIGFEVQQRTSHSNQCVHNPVCMNNNVIQQWKPV